MCLQIEATGKLSFEPYFFLLVLYLFSMVFSEKNQCQKIVYLLSSIRDCHFKKLAQ